MTAKYPNIAPADRAAFKELVKKDIDIATTEPGTLQYDWFFNVDETSCVVREAYANSDAVLAHMGNLGELLGQLAEFGGASKSRPSAMSRHSSSKRKRRCSRRSTHSSKANDSLWRIRRPRQRVDDRPRAVPK